MALDQESRELLANYRMDALVAKHLHYARISRLRLASRLVDFLAIGVPTLYFALRFTMKETEYQGITETAWEFLAAVLAVLSVCKLVFRWDDYTARHAKLMADNNAVAMDAQRLIAAGDGVTREKYEHFVERAVGLENEDRDVLAKVGDADRRRAYREAFKDFDLQGKATCPACGASAYAFRPGTCQICGNTPARR